MKAFYLKRYSDLIFPYWKSNKIGYKSVKIIGYMYKKSVINKNTNYTNKSLI